MRYKLFAGKVELMLQSQDGKCANNVQKIFAVHHINETHLEFRLQNSNQLNRFVFPTMNAKPLSC